MLLVPIVHNLLLFLVPPLSSKPLFIYWCIYFAKHARISYLGLYRIEFWLFLEIPSTTEFSSFLWNICNSCPFCSIIHWRRLIWISGENTWRCFWTTISFWPNSILRGLWECFFQAENAPLWGLHLDHVFYVCGGVIKLSSCYGLLYKKLTLMTYLRVEFVFRR